DLAFFPQKRSLHPEGLPPPRGVAASDFRPLRNIPCCCYPQVSGPCFSTSVGGRALTPPTRLRLGRPLPHQPADGPQAPPRAAACPFKQTPSVTKLQPLQHPGY